MGGKNFFVLIIILLSSCAPTTPTKVFEIGEIIPEIGFRVIDVSDKVFDVLDNKFYLIQGDLDSTSVWFNYDADTFFRVEPPLVTEE
ncbi:hypothetical protein HOC11_05535, partial [archaeon]|nr:hypothetical protein [archaeon]